MSLHLNATLVGLSKKLLNYANVTVLPTTGVTNDLATSVVSIQNPFSAPLRITNIQSNVTSNGFFVGTIIVDTDFTSQGHVGTVSPALALYVLCFRSTLISRADTDQTLIIPCIPCSQQSEFIST